MSDIRGEFDNDDDDFSFDDNEFDAGDSEFDFSDVEDTGAPTGDFDFGDEGEGEFTFDEGDIDLGDEDVPELGEVEEEREGGISRPFLIIAALMILLFICGLVAVLFLARPTGPTEFEMTATSIVMTNQAVEVALNMTQTQSVIDADLTRTAEAFTDTPTPSPSPTRIPTNTPTPPPDLTQIAATELAMRPLTETAQALLSQPIGIGESFATQIAFATQQAIVAQDIFNTEVAAATQGVPVDGNLTATQDALNAQAAFATMAAANVQATLSAHIGGGGPLATQALAATPIAQSTQQALATPAQAATQAALGTQAALVTQLSQGEDIVTVAALATQQAFITPPFLATQGAVATQAALATQSFLVRQLEGLVVVQIPEGDVQLTATALAELLLPGAGGGPTPTGEALTTPGAPRPTALPDTGLFDDLMAGSTSSIGLLALMALGLVGLIVVSRRMRTTNNR